MTIHLWEMCLPVKSEVVSQWMILLQKTFWTACGLKTWCAHVVFCSFADVIAAARTRCLFVLMWCWFQRCHNVGNTVMIWFMGRIVETQQWCYCQRFHTHAKKKKKIIITEKGNRSSFLAVSQSRRVTVESHVTPCNHNTTVLLFRQMFGLVSSFPGGDAGGLRITSLTPEVNSCGHLDPGAHPTPEQRRMQEMPWVAHGLILRLIDQ